MDGAIDARLLITLGGILFSVAGAAAVGKMQIKVILEQLADIESRLRVFKTCDNGTGCILDCALITVSTNFFADLTVANSVKGASSSLRAVNSLKVPVN